jgi:uncharacterized iron-regulated membrane protein
MRTLLLKLHRWAGLALGILILVLAVTGSALVFENDIDARLNANVMLVPPPPPEAHKLSAKALVAAVQAKYPDDPPTAIRLAPAGIFTERRATEVSLKSGAAALVDPFTGEVRGTRGRDGGFARSLHALHTRLLAGETGGYVVGTITAVCFLMSLSGLYLWWPRKLLTLKKAVSWRRVNLDLHHVLGFYSSLVMAVITLSGVIIAFEKYTGPMLGSLDSKPAPNPDVSSTPIAGKTPIDVDEAVRLVSAELPGAETTLINLPPPGKAPFRAFMRFPEDRTPAGRSRVAIDQWSGAVLFRTSTREAELGTRINNLKRSLHTGDVLGWPTQALYFLVSLAIAGQVVTGFLSWWKRAG